MNGGQARVRGLGLRLGATALNQRMLALFGLRLPRVGGAGWMPWLTLTRSAPRPLPGPDWLRVRPTLAGICGTDMALLTGRASPVMSPFVSFPAVLGHEAVGEVVEVGDEVEGIGPGTRVVVDPIISCWVRGLQPCRECLDGHASTCLRSADGPISPGLILGYCRDLPGAWGDEMLVHRSQAYPVHTLISDEAAVLVEPFSVALHAVLRRPLAAGARILVIGGGTLGLLTVAALRLLGAGAAPTVLVRHPLQATMAERLGAEHVIRASAAGEREAATLAVARAHATLLGRTVYSDGFEVVYDCVGSRASLDLALRLTAPRGRVVLLGGPGLISALDLTLAWVRELEVQGTYVYGEEPSLDERPHTFEVALRLLRDHPELPIAELVTHRFALERWRQAMAANLRRGSAGALKTVFDLSARRGDP